MPKILNKSLTINGSAIDAEIADSDAERNQGLSGRESLPQDRGLLFVYSDSGFYRFWMKDMKFAIDIIWLDENFKIIDITPNLSPATYPNDFTSTQPSRYVLEVNAGTAEKNGWQIGQEATLSEALKKEINYAR